VPVPYVSKLLLEKGANPNIQNYEGNSALHFALSRKNFGMADLLKFHGAQEDVINKRGYNPWECLGKSIENAN
jgi:ankyrin repeat protein